MHNAQCTIIGAIGYWRLNVYTYLFIYLKFKFTIISFIVNCFFN